MHGLYCDKCGSHMHRDMSGVDRDGLQYVKFVCYGCAPAYTPADAYSHGFVDFEDQSDEVIELGEEY